MYIMNHWEEIFLSPFNGGLRNFFDHCYVRIMFSSSSTCVSRELFPTVNLRF